MKKNLFMLVIELVIFLPVYTYAQPDYYYGDSSVYAGESPAVRPNIMFLIDNSGAMKDMGSVEPYDPSIAYPGPYDREQVYLRNVSNENNTNYQTQKYTVDEIQCSRITDNQGEYPDGTFEGVGTITYQGSFPAGDGYDDTSGDVHPRFALEQNGFWYGALDSKGTCPANQNQWENYFTGNFRNYIENIPEPVTWTANTDYEAGIFVENPNAESSLVLKCIEGGTSGAAITEWPTVSGTLISDGSVTWEALGTVMEMVQYQMEHVVFKQVRERANMGLMTFGDNNHGGAVIAPVLKAGVSDPSGDVNYETLISGLAQLDNLVNGNTQPVNESLWDAYLYWIGESSSSEGIASDKAAYDSPIQYWCQSNHLVVLTTGSAGNNSQTQTKVGDLNNDGFAGFVDDVAKLLYEGITLDIDGYQPAVNTHVIQLMTPKVDQLERATDQNHGHGLYRKINNPQELIDALLDILAGILEADSSFVAPVVPASPENRAYSGKRIYLGFFKPMNDEPWYGNLKKFGLDYNSQITAFNAAGEEVLATDIDGYFLADDQGNPTVHSFWSTTLDGGLVDSGGVGALLKTRTTPRKIYTYTGTSNLLSDASNNFSVAMDGTPTISNTLLSVSDNIEASKLINFIHGFDSYNDFSTDSTTKRPWLMGDVMHSKPVILNYSKYLFTNENEQNSDLNQAYVFVGANDGMLHAFKDATGEEAWAFIPPDLLPNLQFLRDTDRHYYYVDNSPIIYVYDADGDGNIIPLSSSHPDYNNADHSDDNDRAILLFGMRRGGGTSNITEQDSTDESPPSRGSYYALDITSPENPKFLWKINSEDSGFEELSQTWSLPRLTKMRVADTTKIVAIFGAGYDTNEDLRYGQNQKFPDSTNVNTVTSMGLPGEGDISSSGTSQAFLPRGRGLYIVEIATLNGGVPDFNNTGTLIWSYANKDNSYMTYGFPSDPLVVDRNNDGYIDHIYLGDTGGQLWRFNVESSSVGSWTGTRIFMANSSENGSDVGRKVFYKPTATISGDDTLIYYGSGDREHPRNTAVIDRFYVIRDSEKNPPTYPLTEVNLVDVTKDELQSDAYTDEEKSNIRAKLTPPNYTDGTSTYYGWYIKHDQNPGEKVLAVPKVFSGVVYYTTYQSATIEDSDDPCVGKLGPSRLYAVKAMTGEAAYNFYEGNDGTDTETGKVVVVLNRDDRSIKIGDGIASEPLILVNSDGAVSVMAGRGGGFFNSGNVENIDPIFPVYWMKW